MKKLFTFPVDEISRKFIWNIDSLKYEGSDTLGGLKDEIVKDIKDKKVPENFDSLKKELTKSEVRKMKATEVLKKNNVNIEKTVAAVINGILTETKKGSFIDWNDWNDTTFFVDSSGRLAVDEHLDPLFDRAFYKLSEYLPVKAVAEYLNAHKPDIKKRFEDYRINLGILQEKLSTFNLDKYYINGRDRSGTSYEQQRRMNTDAKGNDYAEKDIYTEGTHFKIASISYHPEKPEREQFEYSIRQENGSMSPTKTALLAQIKGEINKAEKQREVAKN